MSLFRRGDLPEPPPKGWERLGLHPAWTVQTVNGKYEADRVCRANGACTDYAYSKQIITSCAVPSKRLVILGRPQDAAHEYAHTWGLEHRNGRGWYTPDGKKAQPLSEWKAQLMVALAKGALNAKS